MGKVDDVAAFLELSTNGISIAELEKKLGLSADQLKEDLTLLQTKELIMLNQKNDVIWIRVTDRGSKFLDLYNSIKSKYLKTLPK